MGKIVEWLKTCDKSCLLYTSDAADEEDSVDLGGRRIIKNDLSSIVSVCDDPIVSSDIIGTTESAIVDSALTSVNEKIIKLLVWYDNESAYSKRLIDLAELVATPKKNEIENLSLK